MQTIYLIRHGQSSKSKDSNELELNSIGLEFSEKIHIILNTKIDFIAISDKNRCKHTIQKLSKLNGLQPITFGKKEFNSCDPLEVTKKYNVSVICYRIEEIHNVFEKLGIQYLDKDETYDNIYKVQISPGGEKNIDIIKTGFPKKR